jgi:pyruvate dehydrogenase E1 component
MAATIQNLSKRPTFGGGARAYLDADVACLEALHRKVQWLSAWMIHYANRIRPGGNELKVGGHQASSASLATVMTALYFSVLTPRDRVAVKPHASPVFHAIQYLLGNQSLEQLQGFRALGGAQAYPSRTKDADDVDFSTGSVGLGVAVTLFASLAQDYLLAKGLLAESEVGRMIAILGDAELDEGNVHEALIEGAKHALRNTWWIIDYNRQSLDAVTPDFMWTRFADIFRATGWEVITLKYGRKLEAAFAKPGGEALKRWIDDCPNALYSALTFKGGAAWRTHLNADIGRIAGVRGLLDDYDDEALHALMVNLGGHDLELLLDTFHGIEGERPRCFIAYTIKGWGLPFQGHKDNHAGLMNDEQMQSFREQMGISPGAEWEPFAGLETERERLEAFLARVPFAAQRARRHAAAAVPVPAIEEFPRPRAQQISTQEAFGRIMNSLGRSRLPLAERSVTASPDVTVSTNLGGWVNQRGVFNRVPHDDTFRAEHVISMQQWVQSLSGQHFELGIAENNLFLLLAALGLAGPLFGQRLFPIGTIYDTFIARGLDAMNYACYQDARFMLAATPSGITLAPEGGAHQSIYTPLIGMGQDNIVYFEPAYVDELVEIMRWGFDYMQQEGGGSVYLRLSSRAIAQFAREPTERWRRDLLKGAYWQIPPGTGTRIAIAYTGAVVPEVLTAITELRRTYPDAGLLAIPSPDRAHRGWVDTAHASAPFAGRVESHVARLLGALAPDAILVTVIDAAPQTLSWLGAVRGHRVFPLGVTRFGQSGNINDLYRAYGLDTTTILKTCELALSTANVPADL